MSRTDLPTLPNPNSPLLLPRPTPPLPTLFPALPYHTPPSPLFPASLSGVSPGQPSHPDWGMFWGVCLCVGSVYLLPVNTLATNVHSDPWPKPKTPVSWQNYFGSVSPTPSYSYTALGQ